MNRIKFLILLLFLLTKGDVFAQLSELSERERKIVKLLNDNASDSLSEFNRFYYKLVSANYDSIKTKYPLAYKNKFNDFVAKISKGLNEFNKTCFVQNVSYKLNVEAEFSLKIRFLYQLLAMYKEYNNENLIHEIYLNIAVAYVRQGDFNIAMEYYSKCLAYYIEHDNIFRLSQIYNQIGDIYKHDRQFYQSIYFLKKSLELSFMIDDNNNQRSRGYAYNSIAELYLSFDSLRQAKKYIDSTLSTKKYFDDIITVLKHTNLNEGILEFKKKNFEKAIYLLHKSIKLNSISPVYYNISLANHYLGRIYRSRYDFETAEQYFLKAGEINDEYNLHHLKEKNYNQLAEMYKQSNDLVKLTETYEKLLNLNKLISNVDKNNKLTYLSNIYETKEKEKELEILKKEKKVSELREENEFYWRIYIIILLIIIMISIILIYKKYTTNKRLNEELQRKNKLITNTNSELISALDNLNKFFSIISHDLKGPLITFHKVTNHLVTTFSTISRDDFYEYLIEINKETKEIAMLLNNLLEWSNTQTGMIEYVLEPCSLIKYTNKVIDLNNLLIKEKSLSVKINNNTKNEVIADKAMLNTVLRNLISNAIKFSYPNGQIEISINENKDDFSVSIKDFGIGIGLEDQIKLFDISENSKYIGNHPDKGSGLGLKLSKELIEMHDGELTLESKVGEGSTFTFTIPKQGKDVKNYYN